MIKKRIKIPRQDVEDHLQHLTLSCAPVGGGGPSRLLTSSNAKKYLPGASADDETEVILQSLHERRSRRPRLELQGEVEETSGDDDTSSSQQQTTSWTNISQTTTSTSDMSSILESNMSSNLESARSGTAMVAARTTKAAVSRDAAAGLGVIDCIVFYFREIKQAFGRTCCRNDYHADNPGLGYHNYLPGTQCELPQLSYDGDDFKSSRSIDITYLRKRRYAGSNCYGEFEHLPLLFRGPVGATPLIMTHGGKMIDQSIPKEVITPLMYETNVDQPATSTQMVRRHGNTLKMNWLKGIVTLPVQILLRPRRRKNTKSENTPEGEAGTCPNKKSLELVTDVVTSLAAENELQEKPTGKMRSKSPGGVRRSDKVNAEENQHEGRLKRRSKLPPKRMRYEEIKQLHNGRLKRSQVPPIRKRLEEQQHRLNVQKKTRHQSPPLSRPQMGLHLHPRHRTAAVVAAVGDVRHKVNIKDTRTLLHGEQLNEANRGNTRRLPHSDTKKMYYTGPRRHVATKRKH
jgi:hypothetical protein